jgi:hydroxymethylbilane synthase
MRTLRIGTRRSPLAVAQAEEVAARLAAQDVPTELVRMSTTGDEPEAASAEPGPIGRKGLWIDAILEALRTGEVDLAVHSAKDLPAEDDEDVAIAAVPVRADPTDVLVWRDGGDGELRDGLVVGTSSLRRRAQLLAAHPGLVVRELRGNVDTRLRKLDAGEVDAVVLAAAGLLRLGLEPANQRRLGLDEMVPAPGQGALAVQCRAAARDVRAAVLDLDDRGSRAALEAERALTRALGGGCALPLGAFAAAKGDVLRLAAVVAAPDGSIVLRAAGESEDPARAARIVAATLREQGADAILDAVRVP